MTHFRDHADAMRVINATFIAHEVSDQPSQSWMVRRPGESAYHFVVTWIPGRALIVTGDIGATVYSGMTHLATLDEIVRLVREASADYLSGKSTHRKEYDPRTTADAIVERAYAALRHDGSTALFDAMGSAVGFFGSELDSPAARKKIARHLIRTWANLMARASAQRKLAEAKAGREVPA